jgi:hypothetical protein
MPDSRRQGVLAFKKQDDFTFLGGTAAALPATYALPIHGGVVKPNREVGPIPLTSDSGAEVGDYVIRASTGGTVTLPARASASGETAGSPLGLLLYQAMYAQAAGTAVGGVVPHTFTLGDTMPPPLTMWAKTGGQWWKFIDVVTQKLTLSGASSDGLIQVGLDFIGGDGQAMGTDPVSGTDYTMLSVDPRWKYPGSVVNLAASGTSTSEFFTESFEFVVDRVLSPRWGTGLTPRMYTPERTVNFTAGFVGGVAEGAWDFVRNSLIGTTADNTGMTQEIVNGSFDLTLGRHPVDAARSVTITSNASAANWQYLADLPPPDPGGGPFEFQAVGKLVRPASGEEVTVVLKDDKATTY